MSKKEKKENQKKRKREELSSGSVLFLLVATVPCSILLIDSNRMWFRTYPVLASGFSLAWLWFVFKIFLQNIRFVVLCFLF